MDRRHARRNNAGNWCRDQPIRNGLRSNHERPRQRRAGRRGTGRRKAAESREAADDPHHESRMVIREEPPDPGSPADGPLHSSGTRSRSTLAGAAVAIGRECRTGQHSLGIARSRRVDCPKVPRDRPPSRWWHAPPISRRDAQVHLPVHLAGPRCERGMARFVTPGSTRPRQLSQLTNAAHNSAPLRKPALESSLAKSLLRLA